MLKNQPARQTASQSVGRLKGQIYFIIHYYNYLIIPWAYVGIANELLRLKWTHSYPQDMTQQRRNLNKESEAK